MRRINSLILMLVLCGLMAGCDEQATEDPLAQLRRENESLQQQCAAQTKIIFTMGGALILLGAGMAVSLGTLWKKGGRPSAITEKPEGR